MNIAIFGDGKMGKLISNLATERGHSIVLKANSKNPATSFELSDVDVAIDFSIPDTAFDNISHALQNKTPVISGTTNWLDKLEEIKEIESKELYKLKEVNKNHIRDGNHIYADGYPTMGKIQDGSFIRYTGGRSTDELVQWAKN